MAVHDRTTQRRHWDTKAHRLDPGRKGGGQRLECRFSADQLAWLEEQSRTTGLSMAYIIRCLVDEARKKRG